MENFLMIVPVIGVLALLFAVLTSSSIGKKDAGNERMQEIAGAIAEGARAFLMSEYKVLLIFVAVMFFVIGIGLGNWMTAVCFLIGSLFSPDISVWELLQRQMYVPQVQLSLPV